VEERVGPVLELGHLEHHGEEVPGVGELVVRVDVRLTDRVTVGEGGDGRHLGEQAMRLHAPRLGIVDALRVGVEGRERAHGGDQHAHGMRVVAEAVHELLDVLVHDGVHGDVVRPVRQVLGVGELALDEEVGGLQERALLGALLGSRAALAVQLEALEAGREWRLRALVFRGNHALATDELRRALLTGERPWYQRWRVWRPAPEFDPVAFRADLERLRRLYRSRGYYQARVAHDLELPAEGDALTAVVYIDEGPPVVVEEVAVSLGGTAL